MERAVSLLLLAACSTSLTTTRAAVFVSVIGQQTVVIVRLNQVSGSRIFLLAMETQLGVGLEFIWIH
jgi:hypothetical protein